MNIQQLLERISKKVNYDFETADKLNSIVFRTLGSSLEHSIGIKFDYDIALQSLQFFRHQDIDKIEEIHIGNNVSEVKYKSDLTKISPLELGNLKDKQILFNAL